MHRIPHPPPEMLGVGGSGAEGGCTCEGDDGVSADGAFFIAVGGGGEIADDVDLYAPQNPLATTHPIIVFPVPMS